MTTELEKLDMFLWASDAVAAGIPPGHGAYYVRQRNTWGCTHDEAFCRTAWRVSRTPILPFRDDETISFSTPKPREGPKISDKFDQQVFYFRMIRDGQSHRMAEMLATRSFPGIRGTDSTFMAGSHMQDGLLDGVRQRMAKAAGVDTNGKRYIAGLANFPGDPEAWVSGLSDVRRICADRGWNCHGAFEYEAPEPLLPPAPDVPIAADILANQLSSELEGVDQREITPRLIADTSERLENLLSGKVDLGQDLKVSDYGYEDSVAISESE
jgi:hypothetical protein